MIAPGSGSRLVLVTAVIYPQAFVFSSAELLHRGPKLLAKLSQGFNFGNHLSILPDRYLGYVP